MLKDKAFNIAKNAKYDEYQRGLTSMVHRFFDKKTSRGAMKSIPNQQLAKELADELNKPIIKEFKRRILYSSFRDNI